LIQVLTACASTVRTRRRLGFDASVISTAQVAKAPVAMEGAMIEVVEK
jgi:hypothetical protein